MAIENTNQLSKFIRRNKEKMNLKKMNKGLDFLRAKYGARNGEITLKDGHCYVGATPLLPGRMERKIVELKKISWELINPHLKDILGHH